MQYVSSAKSLMLEKAKNALILPSVRSILILAELLEFVMAPLPTNLCCTLRSTMPRSKFSDLLPTASAVQSLYVHEGVSHGHPAEVIICSQPFNWNSVYMHMHMLPTIVDQKHTALLKEGCMHSQKALYLLRWLLVLW